MNNFEKIDRYLKGEMSAEELQAFEVELSANLELRKELFIQRAEEVALEKLAFEKRLISLRQAEIRKILLPTSKASKEAEALEYLKWRIKKMARKKITTQPRIYKLLLSMPAFTKTTKRASYYIPPPTPEKVSSISYTELRARALENAKAQVVADKLKSISTNLSVISIKKIEEIESINYYSYVPSDNRLYDPEVEKKLKLAFDAYSFKNYTDAIELATFHLDIDNYQDIKNYIVYYWPYQLIQHELIGHCNLKLKSFHQASISFSLLIRLYLENISTPRPIDYSIKDIKKLQAKLLEWQWCFLLSYLAQASQDIPLAKIESLISEILNEPDHPDYAQAEELYKMIQDAKNK